MTIDAKTNEILSCIYSTTIDGSKWQDLCNRLNRELSSPIMFFAHDIGSDESLGIMGGGIDPDELVRYHHNFADKNPWMHMNTAMPVGMVGISDQAISQQELTKTTFYNEWLLHQENIIGGPAMICHRSGKSFAALALACTNRQYEDSVESNAHLLAQIGPHIIRSIKMSKILLNRQETDAKKLDWVDKPVFVINKDGSCNYANAAAERFMRSCSLLSIKPDGALRSPKEKLENHIRSSIHSMQTQQFGELPLPLAVMMPNNEICIIHAHILPPTTSQPFPVSSWSDEEIGAFVITGADGLENPTQLERLTKSFGASPAEARLGNAVLSGKSLYDYADENNVSRHTVRNQMRSLLQKTQTSNQTDFVLKMMRLASPF